MAKLSKVDAAKAAGVSRQTLYTDIKRPHVGPWLIVGMVLSLACGGCAPKPKMWGHPTKTAQQRAEDRAECLAQSNQVVVGPEDPLEMARSTVYVRCMQSRGWALQKAQ
jgi:hypothetical protein